MEILRKKGNSPKNEFAFQYIKKEYGLALHFDPRKSK
jgi:hypothetical protein